MKIVILNIYKQWKILTQSSLSNTAAMNTSVSWASNVPGATSSTATLTLAALGGNWHTAVRAARTG